MRNILRLKEILTATNRNFHDNGMLGEGCHCVCVISNIDSAFKMGKNYYPKYF